MLKMEEGSTVTLASVLICPQMRLSMLCIGTSLVFGPILGKSWRLYKVFTQRVPDKRVVSWAAGTHCWFAAGAPRRLRAGEVSADLWDNYTMAGILAPHFNPQSDVTP